MPSTINQQTIISETKQWLSDIVIGLDFCPFAKKVFDNEAIYYHVDDHSKDIEAALETLVLQCQWLDNNSDIETSLIIYPSNNSAGLDDFNRYLDFLDLANELIATEGYEGVYQLASFHPQYQFEDTMVNDAENFTNTSPYPMLHLIREQSLENAVAQYKQPENIPRKNIALAKQKGAQFFIDYLNKLKRQQT